MYNSINVLATYTDTREDNKGLKIQSVNFFQNNRITIVVQNSHSIYAVDYPNEFCNFLVKEES